jgi:phosphoglycolate phosphatase
VLAIVGLSLPQAFAVLACGQPPSTLARLIELYRCGFSVKRGCERGVRDPLFAGIGAVVEALSEREDIILGIATGKSRQGVARLLAREGWQSRFLTVQTADEHPSKPHPSMILRAVAEAGVGLPATLMVGDTTYDIEMARNAQVGAVGVGWGYHPPERLLSAGAHAVAPACEALLATLDAQFAEREAL